MNSVLTTLQQTAIEITSQTLQLQSIAHNTKRMYCHATTHFLNWCEKIDQAAQTSGDLDGVFMQAAVRFHTKHVTPEEINQYLAHLHLNGKSPASIATVLTAIKFMARQHRHTH